MITFGQRLKEARLQKNLSQFVAASHIGINQSTLSMHEGDRTTPFFDTIEAYAKLYGVSTSWLRTGQEAHNDDPTNIIPHPTQRLAGIEKKLLLIEKALRSLAKNQANILDETILKELEEMEKVVPIKPVKPKKGK